MAIYVNSGGSGTSSPNPGAHYNTTQSLFTTPNVTNCLYLISVQYMIDENIVETAGTAGVSTAEQRPMSF